MVETVTKISPHSSQTCYKSYQLTTATMLAMVVASANSFSPSQKTHLATRLAPQAPLRVMPAMKIKSDSWLYVLGLPGFPSQYAKDEERHQVRPYHCARLAPLALAQRAWHLWHLPSPSACTASFRMHIARPCPLASPWSHAPLRPWPLASCPPAPLAPLACWRPSPPWAPRLPGPLASLGPSPPWDPRLPGPPSPPWSPTPLLEPAPAICAVINTTISQPLHRVRVCAGGCTID